MYCYIYKKNEKNNAEYERILSRLKEHKIDGEQKVVENLKDVYSASIEAVEKGFKTIVAVGDDEVFNMVLGAVKDNGLQTVFGYIPLIQHSPISHMLGISDSKSACEILIARKLEEFKLISINKAYFIDKIAIKLGEQKTKNGITSINVNKSFTLKAKPNEIILHNVLNTDQVVTAPIMLEAFRPPIKVSSRSSFWNFRAKLKIKSSLEKMIKLKANQLKIEVYDQDIITNNLLIRGHSLLIGKRIITINLITKKHRSSRY